MFNEVESIRVDRVFTTSGGVVAFPLFKLVEEKAMDPHCGASRNSTFLNVREYSVQDFGVLALVHLVNERNVLAFRKNL
jgi:hypothetical protein